jgi:ribosomal protein L35
MKGNKSFSKRLRVTKRGKIVARVPGHNHFNAKRSGGEKRRNGRSTTFHATMTTSDKSRFFPNT